ncbi:glycosyltransferase [Nocardioides sp. 503]|uniref:glycosyltransferase family 2 protein n=1 Tax=Nocardioides sp. 503 TaxID=2508326 RepID=UPI00106F92F4|nr:glycosyltransferase [Nocardioides sp. 503]
MRLRRPVPLTSRPRVSVVVPCYNYGRFLPQAVASALDQDHVDVDVLIVDDASTDDSVAVAHRIAAGDDRVQVLAHETNQGHIRTYNEGLGKVSGDYLVLLSADDLLTPDALTRATALMEAHPEVGLVYGHAPSFTEAPPEVDCRPRSWSVWGPGEWLTPRARRSRNPVYTPTAVMRSAAWSEIGAYDERLPLGADMLLWYQAAACWGVGRVNNGAQAFYRVHGANMHLTRFAGMHRDLVEQREVLRILFDDPPRGVDLGSGLREQAHRSVVRRARRLALASRRDGAGADQTDAFTRFAQETETTVPAASPRPLAALADGLLEHRAAAFLRRVEEHLRWRLWRRYGV